jgi:hypothetical protein
MSFVTVIDRQTEAATQGVILSRRGEEVTIVCEDGSVATFPEAHVRLAHESGDTPAYGMIAQAIRQQVNKINGYIVNRRQHPSFGYTKTMIREEYQHLLGLGHALALVTDQGTTDSAGFFALNRLLGIQTMNDLAARVRDC